jgi:hypothetical protein
MQQMIDSVTAVEEATIEVIKKEAADLAFQEAIEEAERSARRVKMTEQQKREYALYRKACRFAGVVPTRADFLAGDIPKCVTREIGWLSSQVQQLAIGAAVGR